MRLTRQRASGATAWRGWQLSRCHTGRPQGGLRLQVPQPRSQRVSEPGSALQRRQGPRHPPPVRRVLTVASSSAAGICSQGRGPVEGLMGVAEALGPRRRGERGWLPVLPEARESSKPGREATEQPWLEMAAGDRTSPGEEAGAGTTRPDPSPGPRGTSLVQLSQKSQASKPVDGVRRNQHLGTQSRT